MAKPGLIGRLRPLPRIAPDAAESFGAAIARGFRAMRAHALLGYVLGATFVINGAWYAVMFLGLPLAIEHFGVRGPGNSGLGAYGLVISAYGCTNLLATVVVGSRTLPVRPGMLMFSGTVTVGAGILLLGTVMALPVPPAARLPCLMAAAGTAGIGGPMSDITIATLRQTLLATADMAAAMRAYMAMTNLGVLAAMLMAPALFHNVGTAGTVALCGTAMLLTGVTGMLRLGATRVAPT